MLFLLFCSSVFCSDGPVCSERLFETSPVGVGVASVSGFPSSRVFELVEKNQGVFDFKLHLTNSTPESLQKLHDLVLETLGEFYQELLRRRKVSPPQTV